MNLYVLNVVSCFIMFSKLMFFAKEFKRLLGKSICTEDQVSKLNC